jgi:hypothetical protein
MSPPEVLRNLTTRSRTQEFLTLRRTARSSSASVAATASAEWSAAAAAAPPLWVDRVEKIKSIVSTLTARIQRLDEVHRQRLQQFIGAGNPHLDREIDDLTAQITGSFREANRLLAEVSAVRDGGADAPVRQNIQKSIAMQLQELSLKLRQSQRSYMAALKQRKDDASKLDFFTPDASAGDARPVDRVRGRRASHHTASHAVLDRASARRRVSRASRCRRWRT